MAAGSFANRLAPDGVLVAVDLLLQLTPAAATVSTTSARSGFRQCSVARLLMTVPIHESYYQRDEIVACDGCLPRPASDDRTVSVRAGQSGRSGSACRPRS